MRRDGEMVQLDFLRQRVAWGWVAAVAVRVGELASSGGMKEPESGAEQVKALLQWDHNGACALCGIGGLEHAQCTFCAAAERKWQWRELKRQLLGWILGASEVQVNERCAWWGGVEVGSRYGSLEITAPSWEDSRRAECRRTSHNVMAVGKTPGAPSAAAPATTSRRLGGFSNRYGAVSEGDRKEKRIEGKRSDKRDHFGNRLEEGVKKMLEDEGARRGASSQGGPPSRWTSSCNRADLGTANGRVDVVGVMDSGIASSVLPAVPLVIAVLEDDPDALYDDVGGVEANTELTSHGHTGNVCRVERSKGKRGLEEGEGATASAFAPGGGCLMVGHVFGVDLENLSVDLPKDGLSGWATES
ncbi:hypothetical protein FA13DRAFT_1707433 [Coprinellus micaceus]|uniref:Uncharacterized protein n=1 Tax=Coprinellus micaceus TaxID=71717 RepID=A0A4Y7TKQ5_COPMI|nr:hypothetical protein FA13DRAFT_1707433 [Coprinellus micaceus]